MLNRREFIGATAAAAAIIVSPNAVAQAVNPVVLNEPNGLELRSALIMRLNKESLLRKDFKTAILSNANNGVLTWRLGQEVLDSCFDEVIVSAEIGLIKPDPRIFEYAANKIGVQIDECVFIDDKQSFVDISNELGMSGILYTGIADLKNKLTNN